MKRTTSAALLALLLTVALPLSACGAPAAPSAPDAAPSAMPATEAPAAAGAASPAPDAGGSALPAAVSADKTALRRTLSVAMYPVLDSLVRAMGVEGEIAYAPEDPAFIWSVLYMMGFNFGYRIDARITTEADGTAVVPAQVMRDMAAAAFASQGGALPELTADSAGSVSYDAAADAYRLAPSDHADTFTAIADAMLEPDGAVTAWVALNNWDSGALGMLAFRLCENAQSGSPFPYSVTGASLVTPDAPAAGTESWRVLNPAYAMAMDLDGDGEDEGITIRVDPDAYETTVTVTDGEAVLTDTLGTSLMFPGCFDGDALASDGCREFYITGDMASDDYATYVYRLQDGKLLRGEFYGNVTDADGGGLVTVERNVDVLGTYGAACTLRMGAELTFEIASPYTVLRTADSFEYQTLTVQKDGLPVEGISETATAATLPAGTQLLLAATDAESYAILETVDGMQYRIGIEKKADDWQWYIGGLPESEWFGELPYAG